MKIPKPEELIKDVIEHEQTYFSFPILLFLSILNAGFEKLIEKITTRKQK